MARMPEGPWWRAAKRAWYCTIGGKQRQLARGREGKAQATQLWHDLMSARPAERSGPPALTLEVLRALFLRHAEQDLAPATRENYFTVTKGFCEAAGWGTVAAEVRPFHLTRWIEGKAWAQATRHMAIVVVKVMFAWGKAEGHLDADPLAAVKKPGMTSYRGTLQPGQVRTILDNVHDRGFRDFVAALYETGARPSEIMRVEARHLELERHMIVMPGKTTRRTGRPRVIHLNARMVELCGALAAERPEGPLFRTAAGTAWTRTSVKSRFARLRKRLGMGREVTAKAFRHEWATDALEAGVPVATVAELLGHSSPTMLIRHYSKLGERTEHLAAAVTCVRPGTPSANGTAPGRPQAVTPAPADARESTASDRPGTPRGKRRRRPA